MNAFGPNAGIPFEPYIRYAEKVGFNPGSHTVRLDLHYGGFLLSASRHDTINTSSVYASYDFDMAKVFAGADYAGGSLLESYLGAEAEFAQFAVAGMVGRTGGANYTSLQGTWRATDALDIGLVNRSGTGSSATALTMDYAMTDNVTASAAYTTVSGGFNTVSAGITVDLK